MKKQLLFLLLVLLFFPNYKLLAQQNESIIKMSKEAILYEDPALTMKPKPVDKELYDKWIKDHNRKYGENPNSGPGVPLKVTTWFIVDTIGNVVDAAVIRGIAFGFDEEAWRLVKTNPNKWIPGSINGQLVNTRIYYQIDFTNNRNLIVTKKNIEYKDKQ